jgi:nucleotidyltransferase/DNA polymerase involved in DNA repair
MMALEEMTPRVEQYLIDEMFLDLTGIDGLNILAGACARMCWLQPV